MEVPKLCKEVVFLDVRQECLKVQKLGYPIAAIAKRIGCDPSTLNKWLKGTLVISSVLQEKVYKDLHKMKEEWMEIDV